MSYPDAPLPVDYTGRSKTRTERLRDQVASYVANQCLRVATPHYRSMIKGSIIYGLNSAARDVAMGWDSPPDLSRDESPAVKKTSCVVGGCLVGNEAGPECTCARSS